MNIEGKNILVTGANRGIGAAIVRELLKHKPGKIFAAARDIKNLPDFADARVVPLALDITNEKQVAAAGALAKEVDILINNAGVASGVSLIGGAAEAAAQDMNVNYFGTLAMMRAFLPAFRSRGKGVVANVASILGLSPLAPFGAYSASKAALHSATLSIRAELAGDGVQVLGVYPGPIETEMARDIKMEKASAASAAGEIVAGIVAGDEYIFPDSYSQKVGALWLHEPRSLEQKMAARAA